MQKYRSQLLNQQDNPEVSSSIDAVVLRIQAEAAEQAAPLRPPPESVPPAPVDYAPPLPEPMYVPSLPQQYGPPLPAQPAQTSSFEDWQHVPVIQDIELTRQPVQPNYSVQMIPDFYVEPDHYLPD